MKKRSLVAVGAILVLFILGGFWSSTNPGISRSARAAAADVIPPTVTAIDPSSAFNDLDTSITITGADFTTDFSGTSPTASLGNTALTNVTWVDSSTLTATVPWGLDPGVYTLTVINPDGGTGSLASAFGVKPGIGQWNSGDLFGGEVRQILLKPDDPDTVYASTTAGEFRSRDAGDHWNFISSFMGGNVLSNSYYVIDPMHPSWLYTYAYDGLYRSQDEGDTWIKLINTWPDGRSIDQGQVYVSPHNAQVLFLSSAAQPGYPSTAALGLIKSTNGGASWNIVADMEGISVQDVDFHPTDPLQMVLGTQAGQVFQSTDGGDTWSEVLKPPLSNVGSVTYNPYRPGEVWITFAGDTGLYKSTDAAFTSWQNVTPTDDWVHNLWFIKFTSADSIYTVRQHSEDGGLTWQLFGPVTGYGEISINPDNPQVGYIGDEYYGVQKTSDGGQTWQIKSQGLAGLSAYAIEASRANPLRVYATFEHWPGIYRSDDGANNWTFIPIDGSANVRVVREDPFDPQRIYVAADTGFYLSTDRGESWSALGWNTPPASQHGMPYAMEPDPYQQGHLLVGLRNGINASRGWLYTSSDYGVTWQPITVTQDLAWIVNIAFHPETPGLVYLSTDGTGLYRSTNSGNTWDRIDDLQQPGMQKSASIAIATHPQHMLIDGANTTYRSMDGGATWEPAQSPGGVFAYMFLDGDSTRLYAATWFGLFFSSNAGTSWARAAGVLGKVHITAMDYAVGNNYTILYAATSGGNTGMTGSSMVVDTPQKPLAMGSNLVEAGIYRYVQQTWQTFLPLVQCGK